MRLIFYLVIVVLSLILIQGSLKAEKLELKTGFDPIFHGFSQRNDSSFIIPPEDAIQIGKVRLNYLVIQGCCYGFTHTALNYFYTKDSNGKSIDTHKDEKLNNDKWTLPPESFTATLIRHRQMKNVTGVTDLFVGLIRHLTSADSRSDLDYVIRQIEIGKPVPLLIISLPAIYGGENIQASGHSILVYKCDINSEANQCNLYIHDPNYPRTWNKNTNQFEYDYSRKMVIDLSTGNQITPYKSSGRIWQIWSVDTTYTYQKPDGF